MLENKIFKIVDAVREIPISGTEYTLENSGLVYELCTAGDELNIAKVNVLASGEGDSKAWVALDKLIEDTLLAIPDITEVKIHHRPHSNLSHCPKEIQKMF